MGTLQILLVIAMTFLDMTRGGHIGSAEPLNIALNTRRPSHILSDHFVSLTINPTDLLQGRPFGMQSPLTSTILKGLSPAYIRLGGPDTNRYIFKGAKGAEDVPKAADELLITEAHWKNLNDFLRQAGLDVVVCLNNDHRNGANGKWDPRNALNLITYSDRQQYNLTWQLGYEPLRTDDTTGTQFGKDISQLRSILNAFPRYQQAKIVGPDVRTLHKKEDVDRVLDVLIEAGPAINAVTWHPRWPHLTSIMPSDTSEESYDFPPDYLEWDRNQLHQLLQRSLLKKAFWIGQPKEANSGTFAEGLIYARRLALAAKLGIEVVMKEPSLDDVTHPKPEYWVALLHKKALGRTVLDTHSLTNNSEVSVVAHCTSRTYSENEDGGISILVVNTAGSEQRVILRGLPPVHVKTEVHQYILTAGSSPDAIFSQMTYLNGEPLLMTEEGTLPTLKPKTRLLTQNILMKIPPFSIGLWVVPRAKVNVCQLEPIPFTLNPEDLDTANVLKTTQKGINSLRSINQIFVDKLLKPTLNGVDLDNESLESKERKPRQVDVEVLGEELRKNLDEMKNLLGENMEGFRRDFERTSESAENNLRATERKIDTIAKDLGKAISGVNQRQEFGKFLEVSGLKSDFGKIMMEDKLNAQRKSPEESERKRRKRDLAGNHLLKSAAFDLNEIEKRYQKIFEKHRKNLGPSKTISKLELGIINKELQEEVLLKEITLLEKTEDSIGDLLKNHQERVNAVEELLREELEQLKEEKLAALIEIKSDIKEKEHSNEVLNNYGFKPKREIEKGDGSGSAESKSSGDQSNKGILTAVKTFFDKKKEELNKRREAHEKLFEAQKKTLKAFNDKNKALSSLGNLVTEIPEKDPIEDKTNSTPTESPLAGESKPSTEEKTKAILKAMSDIIETKKDNDDESEKVDENDLEFSTYNTEHGVRRAKAAHNIEEKIADMVKHKFVHALKSQPEIEDTSETFRGPKGKEANKKNMEQKLQLQSLEPNSEGDVARPGHKGTQLFEETEGKNHESKRLSIKEEFNKRRERKSRIERSLSAANLSAAPSAEIATAPEADNQQFDTNTILKRRLPDAMISNMKPDDMLTLASSTVKMVLDKVIPKAYVEAKDKIGNLGLPEYLMNLGKMVENFQRIEELINNVEELEKSTNDTPSHSDFIQKIRRQKRDVELTDDLQNTNTTSLEDKPIQPTSNTYVGDKDEKSAEDHLAINKDPSPPTVPGEEELAAINNVTLPTPTESKAPNAAETENSAIEELDESLLSSMLEENPILNDAMDHLADEMLKEENLNLTKTKETEKEEDDDPLTPTKAAELNVISLIEEILHHHQEKQRLKTKREIKLPMSRVERLRRGLKRDTASPISYPLQPGADPATSQYLEKLRPGVYVVPSKDMTNVHAEQTAKTLEAAQDGKPVPNVVTLNIFYDKKDAEDEENAEPMIENTMPSSSQDYYKYNYNPWNTGQYSPSAYSVPPVAGQISSQPQYATYSRLRDQRYLLPTPPQRTYPYRSKPLLPKYNNPYQTPLLQKPLTTKRIYELPDALKQSSPKLIPVTPFGSWEKPKIEESEVSWLIQSEDKPEEEKGISQQPEEDAAADLFLKKALESAVQETVKEVEAKNKEEKAKEDAAYLEKRKSIEPYWNRTLKEIFQETANDPFWKFLEKPTTSPAPAEPNQNNDKVETKTKTDEETPEHSRKKRSLDLVTAFVDPISNNDINTQSFNNAWLAAQKGGESPVDYYLQENTLENGGSEANYHRDRRNIGNSITKEKSYNLLDNDRVYHNVLPRRKMVDQSGYDVGAPALENFGGSAPNDISLSDPDPPAPEYLSLPVKQIYDIVVDFIRRVANAS